MNKPSFVFHAIPLVGVFALAFQTYVIITQSSYVMPDNGKYHDENREGKLSCQGTTISFMEQYWPLIFWDFDFYKVKYDSYIIISCEYVFS